VTRWGYSVVIKDMAALQAASRSRHRAGMGLVSDFDTAIRGRRVDV